MDGLNELMDKQLAVVSRGQLLALGMTDNAMQYRVRSGGPWQVLLPGVYLGLTGTPDLRQKEVAALLRPDSPDDPDASPDLRDRAGPSRTHPSRRG